MSSIKRRTKRRLEGDRTVEVKAHNPLADWLDQDGSFVPSDGDLGEDELLVRFKEEAIDSLNKPRSFRPVEMLTVLVKFAEIRKKLTVALTNVNMELNRQRRNLADLQAEVQSAREQRDSLKIMLADANRQLNALGRAGVFDHEPKKSRGQGIWVEPFHHLQNRQARRDKNPETIKPEKTKYNRDGSVKKVGGTRW